ncbi:MAG: UMP kinase [Thermodesulfobacteriota bacterium]
MAKAKFKRVLLKLSGEALMGDEEYGISTEVLSYLANEVKEVTKLGVEVGMVIGAGNIFRGVSGASSGMDRAAADNMGMLATVMNSLALKDALDNSGVSTAVLSAIPMDTVCEPYSRLLALDHFHRGDAVIFAAGTGNPYFTTDTAGVLRGLEINANLICKATRVDGVYDKDPLKYDDAVKFDQLTFTDVLHRRLKVMDAAAISLAMDNHQKILVFDLSIPGNIKKAVCGKKIGTLITGDDQ